MKKLLLTALAGAYILTGCASTNTNSEIKPVSSKSIGLLDKYGINESSLKKVKDGYVFVISGANGADIYKTDKNYKPVWKKTTPVLIDLIKFEIKNSKLYLLGYDQNKNRAVLLEYSLDGSLNKTEYFGKKYDLPKDFAILNGKVYVAVTHYSKNNNSDIVIYNSKKNITLSTPYMDGVNFILPYQKGILIVGTVQSNSENVLLAYKTFDNKTVWAETLDMGMDESPVNVSLKNGLIRLKILSTDNMGAQKEATFTIDAKGKIKNIKKGMELKPLPTKYRT
jgi:hypothetical protein